MPQACAIAPCTPLEYCKQPRIAPGTASASTVCKSLIDAVPGALLLLDASGNIASANDTACNWLNGPLLGQCWRDVYQREFQSGLNRGDLSTRDNRLLNISTRPLGDKPGQVVLLSDVTESRMLQQLMERNTRLVSMGEMVARLSHQIRTPIATVVLYLTQMQATSLNLSTQQAFIEKSLARLRHVEKMIRDMLMFAHGARTDVETMSISVVLNELDQQLAPLMELAGAQYQINCDTTALLRANCTGMVTALLNICSNAIENVGPSLRLTINADQDEAENTVIKIADNGKGVAPALRQRVFQPFFTTRNDGTGLGLSVVKSIVEAHNGTIEIKRAAMGGALFVITIPALNTSRRGATQQPAKGGNKRVPMPSVASRFAMRTAT